jgi:hypothetical protein
MKRILLITLFALLSVATFYGLSDAAVCSTCHTMHNSQDGTPFDSDGANERLLKADCVACHTAATAQTSAFSAPAVLHTTNPVTTGAGKTNAGGDFYWVNAPMIDNQGHNVADLPVVNPENTNTLGDTPPGWDPAATTAFTYGQVATVSSTWSSQLTCAGKYGCHGNHSATTSLAAIEGTHHNNGGAVPFTSYGLADASDIGSSYRFLGDIIGGESSNYGWSDVDTDHNEYYGVNDGAARQDGAGTYVDKTTISFLCAECHGLFHADIDKDADGANPWVRHPTDIVLPSTGEYGSYNASGNYNYIVPVARPDINSTQSTATVTPGDDTTDEGAIVMCLSCHRAHGSEYADLLRFNYTLIDAGSGTDDTVGCFVCHTTKNAS